MTTPAILLGLAIGDALGMPFEKHRQSSPYLLGWNGEYWDCDPSHKWNHNLRSGQFTDDTQMSWVLAEWVLNNPGFWIPNSSGVYSNPPWETLAGQYLEWFEGNSFVGPCRGMGGATRSALKEFSKTKQLSPVNSLGTGPIMRCSALAHLLHVNSPKENVRILSEESKITHVGGEEENILQLVGVYLEMLTRVLYGSGKSEICKMFPGKIQSGGAMQMIRPALESAVFCFEHTDSFGAAVQMAIRLGGDTDTVGSITGALAGGYYGIEGIPEKYLSGLERMEDLWDTNFRLNALVKYLLLGITRILFSIFRRLTLYFLLRFHGNLSMETEENLFCNSFCSFAGFPVLVRGLSWFTVPLVKHSSAC